MIVVVSSPSSLHEQCTLSEEQRLLDPRFFSLRSTLHLPTVPCFPLSSPRPRGDEGLPLHSFTQKNNTASSMHTSHHQHSVKRESAAAMTACTCTKMKMIPLELAEKEDSRYSLE